MTAGAADGTAKEQPDVSFVVPTYQEEANLPSLVEHIRSGMADSGWSWELIIANDESGDDTPRVCAELAREHPVRLLNRTTDRGLALAVIDGAKLARGTYIVVMDGDLSHPSTAVPAMVKLLADDANMKMVVGSRNVAQGSVDAEWPWSRRLATWLASLGARPLVPLRDPTSGFFALRTADWPEDMRPIGYKIALEIAVRGNWPASAYAEVPIHFTDRQVGESKMGIREIHNYGVHLLGLYRVRWPSFRVLMQGGVGAVGYFIDVGGFLLLQVLGLDHLTARLISYWPANVGTWWLNRTYTYSDRARRMPGKQLVLFAFFTLIGFAVNVLVYDFLTSSIEFFAAHKPLAILVGVLAGFTLNYTFSNRLVFKRS